MHDDNKALIHRFEIAFAANDVTTIDELCDSNLIDHNPAPNQKPALAGFKETIAMYKASIPDSQVDLHSVIGEGDLVATLWSVSGTHQGDFFGIAATGKRVNVEGMNFYRLTGGKITEVWTQFDGLGLMQQLGVMPTS